MRIALLSCNTGEGHNSTAKAVREVLESRGVECELVDTLAFLSPGISKIVSTGHVYLYKYAPKLWDVSYPAMKNKNPKPGKKAMLYRVLSIGAKKLHKFLTEGQFDAAICSHVFAGMMATELRRRGQMNIPCYLVMTDYDCYPYTDQCDLSGYFIPAKELTDDFTKALIPVEKLIYSGIPVRQAFYTGYDKAQARRKLNLPETGLVVLLMCGSMGVGPMQKIAKELAEQTPEDTTIFAMCARNKKLYESVCQIGNPKLVAMGFTDQVPVYMDAADMIVTKPGGLSSTEAGNKHLPMVFINAVGGCETPNFDFFLERGYAIGSDDSKEVLIQAVELANDPERLQKMRETLARDFQINSAEYIADIIMEAAVPVGV